MKKQTNQIKQKQAQQHAGPNESEISSDVSEVGNNVFKVDFTPEVAGSRGGRRRNYSLKKL